MWATDEPAEHGVVVPLPGSDAARPAPATSSSSPVLGGIAPPPGSLVVAACSPIRTRCSRGSATRQQASARSSSIAEPSLRPRSPARRRAVRAPVRRAGERGRQSAWPPPAERGHARRCARAPIGYLEDGSLQVIVTDPTNVLLDELRLELKVPLLAVAGPEEIDGESRRSRAVVGGGPGGCRPLVRRARPSA